MTPTQNAGTGDNYIIINRYDYSSIYVVGNSLGVDSSPRFVNLRSQFREFAITGVKIELTPNDRDNVAVNGNVTNNLLQNFNVYDDINIV